MARLIGYHVLAVGFFLGVLPLSALAQAPRPGTSARPAAQPAPPTQQIEFKCPKAGTMVTTKSSMRVRDWTSQGSDPNDALLCIQKEGFTTSERHFGNISGSLIHENSSEFKKGFFNLLSEKIFTTELNYSMNSQAERWKFKEVWTIVGREQISIDGKFIDTVVFQQTQENFTRPFKGVARWWLSQVHGIWVKRLVIQSQFTWGEDYEVTKINEPGQ